MARFTHERLILLTAHFFFFLNFSELILLPKYFAHLGLTPSRIGILMGSFSLSVLLALPAAGIASDRMSRKSLFISGAALMAFPTVLYLGLHDSFGALILLRVLQGTGFSCTFGIIGAMISKGADSQERKYMLGMLTVVGISTHALGPVLGEHLISGYGYDMFFASAAIFGLTAFITGFLLGGGNPAYFKEAQRFSAMPAIIASSTTLGVIFGSVVTFLPLYLLSVGIMNSSLFFIPFVTGSILMWMLINKAIGSWPETSSRIASAGLLVLLLLFVRGAVEVFPLAVLSLAFGIGYGYLYPALNAALIGANPESEGKANALFVWSFNVGMLLASLGFGYASEHLGYAGAFMGLAYLGFICMVMTFLWDRRKAGQ